MTGVDDIDVAFHQLGTVLGSHADIVFGIALLASGISSSSVGTMAGQVVMQGYLRSHPAVRPARGDDGPRLRRDRAGCQPELGARLSQVVLSFGIPFALIPLVLFCRNPALMGGLVNRRGDEHRRPTWWSA